MRVKWYYFYLNLKLFSYLFVFFYKFPPLWHCKLAWSERGLLLCQLFHIMKVSNALGVILEFWKFVFDNWDLNFSYFRNKDIRPNLGRRLELIWWRQLFQGLICSCLQGFIFWPFPLSPGEGGDFCPNWKTGKNFKEDFLKKRKGKEEKGKEKKKKRKRKKRKKGEKLS